MRIVQAGDLAPASEIYDRYSTHVYNFAYRFLRNTAAAEDATQEVFMRVIKHANQYKSEAKFSTWLFTITANWCRDFMRKADNKRKESDSILLTLPASHEYSPDRATGLGRGHRNRRSGERRRRRPVHSGHSYPAAIPVDRRPAAHCQPRHSIRPRFVTTLSAESAAPERAGFAASASPPAA